MPRATHQQVAGTRPDSRAGDRGLAGLERRGRAGIRSGHPRSAERDREHREGVTVGRESSPTDKTLLNWHTAQNDIPTVPDCIGKPADACIVVHGTGPRVLLMGDSIARMWTPAFMAIARHDSLTLAIASYPACPWQLLKRHGLDQSPRCPAHARYWYYRMIPGYNPDVIVLAERAFDAPGNILSLPVNGRTLRVTTAPAERTLAAASKLDLRLLHRAGRKIVILQPTPLAPALEFNQLGCLSTGKTNCAFRYNPAPTALMHQFDLLANNRDVFTRSTSIISCARASRGATRSSTTSSCAAITRTSPRPTPPRSRAPSTTGSTHAAY